MLLMFMKLLYIDTGCSLVIHSPPSIVTDLCRSSLHTAVDALLWLIISSTMLGGKFLESPFAMDVRLGMLVAW